MSPVRIEPGARFGAYQIVGPLGRGGMATVWKAYETSLDRYVALKVLPAEFLHEPTFAARFQREARVVAKLEHPNIVPIFAYGIEGEIPWMSMRLIAGPGGGSSHLAALLHDGRVLPRRRAVEILTAVADALSYAHDQGVLHRDVKPQNILLDDTGRVYLADFGIARMLEGEAALTRTGLVSGTPQYMAPEHALGTPLDHRVDIYALGTVAYEMLTGSTPFAADTPVAVLFKHVSSPIPVPPADYVPEPLLGPLLRSLAKDPAERYERATDFTDALARGLAELPPEPLPPPPPPRRPAPVGGSFTATAGAAQTASTAPTLTSAPTLRATSATDPTVAVSRGTVPVAGNSAAAPPKRGAPVLALAGAAIVALAVVGFAVWWRSQRAPETANNRSTPSPTQATAQPTPSRPSTASAPQGQPSQPSPSAATGGTSETTSQPPPPATTSTAVSVPPSSGAVKPTSPAGAARAPRSTPAAPIRAQAPAAEAPAASTAPVAPPPPPEPSFPAGALPWRIGGRIPIGLTAGPSKLDAIQFKTLPKGELEAQLETTCADGQDQLFTFDVALYGEDGGKLANFGGERSLDEGDKSTFRKKFRINPTTLAAARAFRVTIKSADD